MMWYNARMQKATLALSLAVSLVAVAGCNQGGGSSGGRPAITSEDDKTFYALGLMVGRNVNTFNLSPRELEIVKAGMTDSVTGKKPIVELEQYGPKIQGLARSRAGARAQQEKDKAKTFQDSAAKEKGAVKEASGLVYVPLQEGTGDSPKATDTVKVHYEGKLTDGTIFDSSVQRGQPAEFPLNGVIPCWTEGMQKIKVGGKAKLVCPSSIAYGDQGRPPKIPGGATLVFEVQLLEIVKKDPNAAPQLTLQPGGPGGLKLPPPGMKTPPGHPAPPPPTKEPAKK
jgi:FKBP-type peptidyl-prolyl cis-trans isomerase FkpA